MVFEVIPGGLRFKDDIPGPDKPIEEWTPEEHEEYDRYLYEHADPGSPEAAIKAIDISPEALSTVIDVLCKVQVACEKEAEVTGFQNEWSYLEAEHLLKMLRLRQQEKTLAKQLK